MLKSLITCSTSIALGLCFTVFPDARSNASSNATELQNAGTVSAIQFSQVNNILFTGNASGDLQLWDPNSGKLLRTLAKHKGGIISLAVSQHGKTIATGAQDGSIRLWDAVTGKELNRFQEKYRGVYWIAFAGEGQVFFAASRMAGKFARTREGPVFEFT